MSAEVMAYRSRMFGDLLGRKAQPTPEDIEAQAAAERQAQLEARLREALSANPLFQVTTVDGLKWLCPYTGARIEATFGFVDPALDYLVRTQPWTTAKTKTLAELLRLRWNLWLRDHLKDEPRAQFFVAGRWLNPLDGQWLKLPGFDGKVGPAVLETMAAAMAACPQGRGTQLRERAELEKIARAAGHDESGKAAVIVPAGGHTRVSGTSSHPRPATQSSTDLDLAGGILSKILSPMPNIAGWRFAAHYEPHAQVGGDLYEAQRLDERHLFVALADVTGHGVQGAMVVVSALKALRYAIKHHRGLVDILVQLNDDIRPDLLDGQFITCWAGIIDLQDRTVDCVWAGHHPALIARANAATLVERVATRGMALGLARGDTFRRTLKPLRLTLEPGDILLQYTDGFTEAMDARNRQYGESRLAGRLLQHSEDPFPELLPALSDSVRRWAIGSLGDDATMLAISPEPLQET